MPPLSPTSPPGARRYKDAIYEQFARISRAAANPIRLELLDLLAQGPRTVEGLARETGQSLANTSQHLQVLRAARLVQAEKQGLHVRYTLPDDHVTRFYRELRLLAEARAAEVHQVTRDFLAGHGQFEAVDQDALLARVARGQVRLIDVRPAEEFRAGHIPGAISLPLADLERRLKELPRRAEIVAYCRGPYCVLAVEAVARLRARGYRAVRLEAGVPDWRALGLAVETGESGPPRRRAPRSRRPARSVAR
jgi:rhodanese-related sulfurtransferase/DNA-binding transcriptional ArsR family regulator